MIRHPALRPLAEQGGFGTLEAVIALLIASVSLTALTVIATNSIDRARRADIAFQEAMTLEKLSACIQRIPRHPVLKAEGVSADPHPCREVQAGLDVFPGSGALRTVRSRDLPSKTFLVLNLESQEP